MITTLYICNSHLQLIQIIRKNFNILRKHGTSSSSLHLFMNFLYMHVQFDCSEIYTYLLCTIVKLCPHNNKNYEYLHLILYLVSPILFVLLDTNCKSPCIVTNTKCKPHIICHSLSNRKRMDIIDLQCYITLKCLYDTKMLY